MEDLPAWETWARTPYCPTVAATPPTLGFLPPLQRRRLSPLARMAVACAWPLADGRPAMPLVYASHHGETTRSFDLLQCLARDEALSPTSFSLSVHNATAGLWSILRKETVESVALSAAGDGLESAIAEACLLLDAGHEEVLVILAEETPPAGYRPWIDDVPFSYALALRIGKGDAFQLRLSTQAQAGSDAGLCAQAHVDKGTDRDDGSRAAGGPGDAHTSPCWPHPLNLLRHLILGTPQWRHPGRAAYWQWRRAS
ncbi:beta-ketoacyl synthase chain length factor [Bordetella sp. H567]|uniref:beta-ketoacyl synthase chain length factor n=1 Tax=Bordetella sp. H567 TaxID=1697043 RepID=UPI000AA2F1A4|nr:beta-ketoacyl synthase chain length factor [Bordetella sp. H567]